LPANKSPRELAGELGWTPAQLNELIKGRSGITAEAALDLAYVLGTSQEVWMNLQSHFDLAEAKRKRKKAS
jgi:addiction module HigA family antidote